MVARTSAGRWTWWPALGAVDFLPKHARHPTVTLALGSREDTEAGALRAIVAFYAAQAGRS